MKAFQIVIQAEKTNEVITIYHLVHTEDEVQAKEIATEDILRLVKEKWLIARVEVNGVGK